MGATYRDETEGLKLQIESLLERYRDQSKSLAEPLCRLYVRRSARMLAGKVATFSTAFLALLAAFNMIRGNMILTGAFKLDWHAAGTSYGAGKGGLTLMLLTTLVMVVIAYVAGLLLARGELTAKLARAIPLTGDAHRDLAQLEAASPDLELRRILMEQGHQSISLPLVGTLMLLPISLHLAIYMLFWALPDGEHDAFAHFDSWIAWSVVLVTHAQLIIACMASRFPRRLAERYAAGEQRPRTGAGLAVCLTTVASFVPGACLDMIPPILPPIIVALTGAVVVIPAFYVARWRFLAERALLGA